VWLEIKLNAAVWVRLGTKQRARRHRQLIVSGGWKLLLSAICLYLSIYWAIYLFVGRKMPHTYTQGPQSVSPAQMNSSPRWERWFLFLSLILSERTRVVRLIYRPDTETQTAIVSDALARRGRACKNQNTWCAFCTVWVFILMAVAKFYLYGDLDDLAMWRKVSQISNCGGLIKMIKINYDDMMRRWRPQIR